MKKVLFIVVLIFNAFGGWTQKIHKEILEKIDKTVPQNILIYYIKTRPVVEGELEKDSKLFMKHNANFYNAFMILPRGGYKLDYQVTLLPFKYPKEGWWLYQIYWTGEYLNVIDSSRVLVTSHFPYSFMKFYYLVAISKHLEIKFISGNFYRHKIAQDFDLNPDDPESYLYYLQLKTYNYQTRDIKFKKRKDNVLIYTAYSEQLQRDIEIYLDLNDVEEFTVKYEDMPPLENYGKKVPFK